MIDKITSKEIELNLQGEAQKAVWSLMWANIEMRSSHLMKKTGRRPDVINHVLTKLIDIGAIERVSRGIYKVCDNVVK